MNAGNHPRETIEALIGEGDLRGLLLQAAQVHGHYCPGLASGVKAAYVGVTRLNLVGSEGMEDVMAEVECNNCFVDGIQVVSGCTFGNNALIYRDLGKTAVTFYRRGEDEGLRICVTGPSAGVGLEPEEREEAAELFDRAVRMRQELSEQDSKRFRDLWKESAFGLLEVPASELFRIETVAVQQRDYAPIVDSVTCSVCGEKVMETRAQLRAGAPVCLCCAGASYWTVDGSGVRPCL